MQCNVMSFREVSASEVVIWDPPRLAQPYSNDMEAMTESNYDVYGHSTSITTAGWLPS